MKHDLLVWNWQIHDLLVFKFNYTSLHTQNANGVRKSTYVKGNNVITYTY